MNTLLLKCPNCDADLEIDENGNFCFCQYCGCKILIDNGHREVTITKNINSNRTSRHIDDADIIRAENERRQIKHDTFCETLVLIIGAIVIFGIVGFNLFFAL